MFAYLPCIIGFVCMFHSGLCGQNCDQGIMARRQVAYAPAGDALSLSCIVRHCGLGWTGTWLWRNSTDEHLSEVNETETRHVINLALSADEAQLTLKILRVNQADEGFYGCSVTWVNGYVDQGHLTYVNVTAAVLKCQRDFLHRILILAGAFLCLPIIVGLARCLSSAVKLRPLNGTEFIYTAVQEDDSHPAPEPPPRPPVPQERNVSLCQGFQKTHQKTEVVYSDICHEALQQHGATREPIQSTVYSFLKCEEPFVEQ